MNGQMKSYDMSRYRDFVNTHQPIDPDTLPGYIRYRDAMAYAAETGRTIGQLEADELSTFYVAKP